MHGGDIGSGQGGHMRVNHVEGPKPAQGSGAGARKAQGKGQPAVEDIQRDRNHLNALLVILDARGQHGHVRP